MSSSELVVGWYRFDRRKNLMLVTRKRPPTTFRFQSRQIAVFDCSEASVAKMTVLPFFSPLLIEPRLLPSNQKGFAST
jgi:hypothetical protein